MRSLRFLPFGMCVFLGALLIGGPTNSKALASGADLCGDGMVTGGEECDDGGTTDGDGCNAFCQEEYCGDGVINDNGAEDCDDGNDTNNDSCPNNCKSDDGDGVVPGTEASGPGYGVNGLVSGDGNGDGIVDNIQSRVATLPAANGNGFLTVTSTLCDLTNVSTSLPDDTSGHAYPYALVGFTLPDCEITEIKIYYQNALDNLRVGDEYRKFGPTTPGVPGTAKYYSLPGVVFGAESVNGTVVGTATFTLRDNQLGDATGNDGTIVDPGGPSVAATSAPLMSPMALAALMAMLTIVGALRITRFGKAS